jgi:ribonuclease P protein component
VGDAVVRNRIKRIFREIFRKSLLKIPKQFDIVINAKSCCNEARYIELNEELLEAVAKIC